MVFLWFSCGFPCHLLKSTDSPYHRLSHGARLSYALGQQLFGRCEALVAFRPDKGGMASCGRQRIDKLVTITPITMVWNIYSGFIVENHHRNSGFTH